MSKLTIEKALNRLDEITNSLESNEKDLKEILKLYEEGMDLILQSKHILNEAELKVKQFKDGNLEEYGDIQNE